MLRVDSTTAPFGTLLNMDVNSIQADEKSGDLKNTQVTFTKKKVSNARKKLDDTIDFKKRGAAMPLCTITGAVADSAAIFLERFRKSCTAFSTHK